MGYLIFIAGILTGMTIFYMAPKLRPLIRDKFLPWAKGLRRK